MKNKINHQNDVRYIRKICNKLSEHDRQKNNKKTIDDDDDDDDDDGSTVDATAAKKPIGDGLLITTVTAMAAGICFGLRIVGIEQQGALLTSTSFVYFLSFFRPREA